MRPALLLVLLTAGCAHSPTYDPQDPLERVNRAVFGFNEKADQYVLRPVAKGYDKITPAPVRTGIANFFDNLFYPTVIVNDVLQGKLAQGASDLGRFVVNTTLGVVGLFDVATGWGMEKHDEDLGQTLGYWGLGPGWFLMLPLLGPSDNRDLVGRIGDAYTYPLTYVDSDIAIPLRVVDVVDTRARFLPADKFMEGQLDRYTFLRTAYLERRQNLVYDGNPPKEDLGFEEEEEEEVEVTPPADPAAPAAEPTAAPAATPEE